VPSWFGFMGPAGLPAPIVTHFETEVRKALEDPEISKKLEEVGITPIGSTGAEMAARLRSQTDDLARLAKQVGIQPD
jgi:tripartite-type tricarboxylate transporter receptor subunit TctC